MMKTMIAAPLALALTTGAGSAQQRTMYDARGKVISRETTSGNQTTIYDASGRNAGRVTTSPQR